MFRVIATIVLAVQASQEPWRPTARVLDAYSRNISLSVAVESKGDATEVFSGAGGEVFALRHERGKLALARNAPPYTWSTAGVVLDIALAQDFAYVAAFRDGLHVFDRSDKGTKSAHWPAPANRQVLCVACVEVGMQRIIAIGTESHDGARGGEFFVLRHDRERGALIELVRIDLGAPVFTLAATELLGSEDADFALFVGTGCAPGGALQRFDLALNPGGAAQRADIVDELGWNPRDENGALKRGIVRDLVLDPYFQRLYAAAFWDGVQAFDIGLEQGGLKPLAQDGWPLFLPNDPELGFGCRCETGSSRAQTVAHALAFTDPGTRLTLAQLLEFIREREHLDFARQLVVALGPARTDVSCVQALSELNGYAPCNADCAPREVHACTDPDAPGPAVGLFSFDLVGGALSDSLPDSRIVGAGARGGVGAIATSLAIANVSESGYDLFAANTAFGLQTYYVASGDDRWQFNRTSAWSGAPPARMPMPAFDDLLVVRGERDVLLAACEGSLAAFDLDAESRAPLSRPWLGANPQNASNPTAPWLEREHGILLTHFEGENARVIAATRAGGPGNPGGLAFYDASNPARPVKAGETELDRRGFGYGVVAARGLVRGASEARRWLYTTQEIKALDQPLERWSVRLWDLGTANAPLDPTQSAGPSLLAVHETTREDARELGGLAVLDDCADEHFVYALYAPRAPLAGEATRAGDAGLLALRTRAHGDAVELVELAQLPAFSDVTWQHRSVRATIDHERSRLYAAWTGLLAICDIADPARPRWIARRDLRGRKGLYGLMPTPVQVAPGPTLDGRHYVYVALLNDGLGVLDATDAASFEGAPLHVITTPWQTTAVLVDPRDPSRRRVFAAEGTRGLEWLELR